MKKIKILFVLEDLRRAGAQRYMYELIKILDRGKFDLEILCGISSNWKNKEVIEEYYFLFEQLGIVLHRLIGKKIGTKRAIPVKKSNILEKGLIGKIYRRLNQRINPFFYKYFYSSKIKDLLDIADYIVVIDFYTYEIVKPYLKFKNNFEVHIMCHKVQYPNLFSNFESNRNFTFFYFDALQRKEIISNGFSQSHLVHQPLLIDLDNFPCLYTPLPHDEIDPINIAILTRISGNDKLIDIFIIAFASLIAKSQRRIHLKLVGETQSDIKYVNHLKNLIRFLNITDFVEFSGHQSDLKTFLIEEKIHIAWHFSIGDNLGYAGIEITSYGIPSVLYSLYNVEDSNSYKEHKDFSNEVTGIIQQTLLLLEDTTTHEQKSREQRQHYNLLHNSARFSSSLNEYYSNILKPK